MEVDKISLDHSIHHLLRYGAQFVASPYFKVRFRSSFSRASYLASLWSRGTLVRVESGLEKQSELFYSQEVHRRPHRLTVRTDPSHGSNRGSIPREVTNGKTAPVGGFSICDLKHDLGSRATGESKMLRAYCGAKRQNIRNVY